MEKGLKSRRKILGVAFKLFASYSYPDVSYSLLEEASGISRGSMVYYFKNKEGIFRAVLETFFYGPDNPVKVKQEENISLKKFYNLYVEKIRENISLLLPYNIPNLSEARFNIERSACQFIPEFKEQASQAQIAANNAWQEVIGNSIRSGELRPDIDIKVTADLFQSITLGFFYRCSRVQPAESIDSILPLYDAQYNLIKN